MLFCTNFLRFLLLIHHTFLLAGRCWGKYWLEGTAVFLFMKEVLAILLAFYWYAIDLKRSRLFVGDLFLGISGQ
jgi:hypothetical protein